MSKPLNSKYERPLNRWFLSQVGHHHFHLSEQIPIRASHTLQPKLVQSSFHMHYEVELGIVCRGQLEFYIGQRHRLGPGDTWLVGIWEPHYCRMLQAPCETIVLTILPQFLVQPGLLGAAHNWFAPFTTSPKFRLVPLPMLRPPMLAIGRRLAAQIDQQGVNRDVWLRILLIETLTTWCEHRQPPQQDSADKAAHYARLNRAVQLVFASQARVSPQKAANACGMSRGYFDIAFRKAMGISFAQFALRYRLSGVARQLLNTNELLKTIALSWGFVDVSHLHHHFIRHYGCTPNEYRRQCSRSA